MENQSEEYSIGWQGRRFQLKAWAITGEHPSEQKNAKNCKKTQKMVLRGVSPIQVVTHTIKKRLTVILAKIYRICAEYSKIDQTRKNTFIASRIKKNKKITVILLKIRIKIK